MEWADLGNLNKKQYYKGQANTACIAELVEETDVFFRWKKNKSL